MFCQKCGSENLEYAKFCKDCGERFFQNQSRFNSLSISKKNFTKKQKITTYVFGIVAIMIIVIGVIIYLNTGTRLAAKQVEDGKRHLASKQFNDSIQDFEKAIKTDKNTPQAYMGLADAYIGLDNDQKAEENLQNGIKASPESDVLYIKLADMYSDEGKTEEAVQILKDRSNTAKTQNIQTQIEKLKSTINTYGNTPGNIMNSGLVAGQGNWLYYSNSSDNWNLYKIRADGSEKEKLNNEISSRINVAGDWIYYTDKNMKLYRMRTDAAKNTLLDDDSIMIFYVIGDWIYYNGIYKMRTDGTEKTLITKTDNYIINVQDDWIYYSALLAGGIHKIRKDGSENTQLDEMDAGANLSVVGDWVYYVNTSLFSDGAGYVHKIRTDGSEKTKLDIKTSNFNIVDDWIYYSNSSDQSKLYKIRADGTDNIKLSDDIKLITSINVVGDWIYYVSIDGDIKITSLDQVMIFPIYKIRTDGTENQPVT